MVSLLFAHFFERKDAMDQKDRNILRQIMMEDREAALLKSSTSLADVVKKYRSQDVKNEGIIDELEDGTELNMEPPIYRQSAQYAVAHGESDAYFASCEAYLDCKFALDQAIENNFDGIRLGHECISEVMKICSQERVADVLACTVRHKDWDGHFSQSNKAWANSIDTSHMEKEPYPFLVDSHPAVLDVFVSMFRREVLECNTTEKNAENPDRKPNERSDDFEL